jgi:uncharacterized iron-regulated membrane protein
MWWKRRPSGRSGLPGPASPATRANTPKRAMVTVAVVAIALGMLFPAFGISLIVVLIAEGIIAARRDHASRVTSTTTSRSVDPSPE